MESRIMESLHNENKRLERILMTIDTVGGVWNYAVELITGLVEQGIEVVVATMGPLPDSDKRSQISRIRNVELFESSFKLEWMENPWKDIEEASEWLLELEILTHPDIVHLNGFVHGALPWHSPVLIVGHSCVSSWFEHVKGTSLPEYMNYYKKKVCEGLKTADYVVAPTKWMLDTLQKHYGVIQNAAVIHNGRKICEPNIDKEDIVFSAGRIWDEAKNIHMLTENGNKFNWPLIIAGDYENNGNFENATLTGVLKSSDVINYMKRASIFVLPVKYEPFGLSILEAAICGCPLILGDIGSLRELWDGAAIFVDPKDSEMLVNKVNELIADKNKRIEYAEKAKKRAMQYSTEEMVSKYISIYNCMLKKRPITNYR